jgi:hypothetical protein
MPFSGALPSPEEDRDIREYADHVEPRLIGVEGGERTGGPDTVNMAVTNQGE